VSNLHSWTVKEKKSTITADLTLPSGKVSTVELSLPTGVKLSSNKSKTIEKDFKIKSGSKTISYKVSSTSSSHVTVKPNKGEKSLALAIDTKLFKTKDKSATLTLIVKSGSGTTYTEHFKVKV
jgi:hypothetical protein